MRALAVFLVDTSAALEECRERWLMGVSDWRTSVGRCPGGVCSPEVEGW